MNNMKSRVNNFYYKYKIPILIMAFIALILVPIVYPKKYFMGIMCRILVYSILAGSLNVINGYTNQFSLGHAGFFCIGAYVMAILSTRIGWNFWIVLPIAGILTAIVGYLVSLPTLKMEGLYLALVTIGFSEIIRIICLNWTDMTGGSLGIKGIPVPVFFGFKIKNSLTFYYIFLVLAILFCIATNRIIESRIGRAWKSLREDQLAARSLGVEASRFKSLNFIYAAFWAGIAGAAFAPYLMYIDSTIFTLEEGFNILSMVIIGGMGTMIGPITGAIILQIFTEALRFLGEYRMVIYGLLIILTMWFRPQGLLGSPDTVLATKSVKVKRKRQRSYIKEEHI